MSTTLGGTTLPNPAAGVEGCSREAVGEGGLLELADGSVLYDYTVTRYRWQLHWVGMTGAELTTIATKALVKTSQAFSPPDEAGSYTVYVVPNSFKHTSFETGSGTSYYNVDLAVEEVS